MWKVLSQGMHMWNRKVLSLVVHKVKVFVYGRRRRQQQQQQRRRRGYDNRSPDFRLGELKTAQHLTFCSIYFGVKRCTNVKMHNCFPLKTENRLCCIIVFPLHISSWNFIQRSREKEDIWFSLITKAPTPTEKFKRQRDNTKQPYKKIRLHNKVVEGPSTRLIVLSIT